MSDRRRIDLGPAQETLLIPLYGRAAETRKRRPLLSDPLSVEMVEAIDYDFAKFEGGPGLGGAVLRGLVFDHWTRGFLSRHPRGTVVEIGAGLNTRFERLDNGTCHWVDLDLPDTMALRRTFFTDTDRRSSIAASVVDETWVDAVRERPGPYFFVAEAVLIYLAEADARTAVGHVHRHFPGSRLALDTWGRWIIDNRRRHPVLSRLPAPLEWGCDDPRDIEAWHRGTRLLASHNIGTPPAPVRRGLPVSYRLMLPVLRLRPRTRSYRLNLFELGG